jgi:NAD-dependent deacetylase
LETICGNLTLSTQNVDGLHQKAGSRNVLELHGSICLNRCVRCGTESSASEDTSTTEVLHCRCGGLLRPAVVWFGESLPKAELDAAFQAAKSCDLFLTVGTSSVVYPAAALPEIASNAGAMVIEVNIEETPLTSLASFHLRGLAGTILPELVAAYEMTHPGSTVSSGIL